MKKSIITVIASLSVATQITTATENLVTASNTLGLELYSQIQQKSTNTCYSPFSIQTAMLMAYNGAAGETNKEMHKILRLGASQQTINKEAKKYHTNLITGTSKKQPEKSIQNKTELLIANKIFIEENLNIKESFTNTLKNNYHSKVEKLPFTKHPDQSRNHINNYVSKATKNKINNLLPERSITPLTTSVLVNSIYFKASWQKAFSPSKTAKRNFITDSGTSHQVDTMSTTTHLGYHAENNYELITIPYSSPSNFQLLIILPQKNQELGATMKDINANTLAKAKSLPSKEIQLFIPKFKIDSPSIDLKDTFKELGMSLAFSEEADFTNMFGTRDDIKIGAIFHKANIEVGEKGTVATAATAVLMEKSVLKKQPFTIKINKPFFFAIQDKATGNCLFMGDIKKL